MNETVRAVIYFQGRVQGVGFRFHTRRVATDLKLLGIVENLADGSVRAVCEGPRKKVEEFVRIIKETPPPIQVEEAEVSYSNPTGEFKAFSIVTGDLVQEMVEGFSTGSSYLQVMLSKQDQMLEKQEETVKEIKDLRSDLRSLLDERFSNMEKDIAGIKAKIGLVR